MKNISMFFFLVGLSFVNQYSIFLPYPTWYWLDIWPLSFSRWRLHFIFTLFFIECWSQFNDDNEHSKATTSFSTLNNNKATATASIITVEDNDGVSIVISAVFFLSRNVHGCQIPLGCCCQQMCWPYFIDYYFSMHILHREKTHHHCPN